jgi:hypothetical protein
VHDGVATFIVSSPSSSSANTLSMHQKCILTIGILNVDEQRLLLCIRRSSMAMTMAMMMTMTTMMQRHYDADDTFTYLYSFIVRLIL